jgi:hypothetical protein
MYIKQYFMSLHKGKPSGRTKSEGTGTPSHVDGAKLKKDKKLTEKYTDDDKRMAASVKTKHANRNVNKTDATNAGGYKN